MYFTSIEEQVAPVMMDLCLSCSVDNNADSAEAAKHANMPRPSCCNIQSSSKQISILWPVFLKDAPVFAQKYVDAEYFWSLLFYFSEISILQCMVIF